MPLITDDTKAFGKLKVGTRVPCHWCQGEGIQWSTQGSNPQAEVCGPCNGWGQLQIRSFDDRQGGTWIIFTAPTDEKPLDTKDEVALK